MAIFGNNTAYVAARAKSRKSNLMDRTRLRQLIQQSPDQLTVAVADNGYRTEIDLYAGHFTGGDLVEAALTHNLQSELSNILNLCNGKIRGIVEIYTNRFQYHNAKVVLRAVSNEVDVKKVSHSILPEESEINIPWLKIIEESNTLRDAVEQMRRLSFGKTLLALGEDEGLQMYEDALDRHYFKHSLGLLQSGSPDIRILRNHLGTEIDHRNIINILEGQAFGLSGEEIIEALITWLRELENAQMQRMSYLHPISALPVIHYVSAKIQEIEDLRFIVRGRMAGLSTEVLEAHVL